MDVCRGDTYVFAAVCTYMCVHSVDIENPSPPPTNPPSHPPQTKHTQYITKNTTQKSRHNTTLTYTHKHTISPSPKTHTKRTAGRSFWCRSSSGSSSSTPSSSPPPVRQRRRPDGWGWMDVVCMHMCTCVCDSTTAPPPIHTQPHNTNTSHSRAVLSYFTDGGKKMRPVDWVVHWWSYVTMRFIGYCPKVRTQKIHTQ